MSSHAAAAISAMITSQVYPQLRMPPPARTVTRQQREQREAEAVVIFSKGTNQAIGVFQIMLGMGFLLTVCVAQMDNLGLASVLMSFTASLVYITNGIISCSRSRCRTRGKRHLVVRVTITANIVGALTALISIVIYSMSLDPSCFNGSFCSYAKTSSVPLLILLFLSFMELVFALLTTLYGWKNLDHIDDLQDPVVFSREGWRDGGRHSGDGKLLGVSSSAASLEIPESQQP
ncbi:hypothetical protein AGOR_G00034490 [Albula goreensis]|uniref:Membrane-spanning 4-domains subfamily A member 4A-like n=1 Tax=Albula goreensis TaxID=1534307 RepID=A0A8T3DWH6_9TELE|nr:hypothetical protein AGOR_G00034490 [Albula goreensis]